MTDDLNIHITSHEDSCDPQKKCNWCKTNIDSSAKYCKECGLWQSRVRQWISPGTVLSIVGALAAWMAVIFQIMPKAPNPVLVAVNAVEALEFKAEEGCERNKTNACVHDFWFLLSEAENARKKVSNFEVRKELSGRIDSVVKKHGAEYAVMYEWEP